MGVLFGRVTERVDSDQDHPARIGWRGVRALILARRGETAAAIEMARSAVAMAGLTDALWMQGRAFEDLAKC